MVNGKDILHPADFEVSYRFLSSEEGGRPSGLPMQGYRCDWSYLIEDDEESVVYMIWPEFEDVLELALATGAQVIRQGNAKIRAGRVRK